MENVSVALEVPRKCRSLRATSFVIRGSLARSTAPSAFVMTCSAWHVYVRHKLLRGRKPPLFQFKVGKTVVTSKSVTFQPCFQTYRVCRNNL